MAHPSHPHRRPHAHPRAQQQYLHTRVMTASPEQLQMMLYDGLVRFAESARSALERRDLEAVHTNVTRAQAIVTELLTGLRPAADRQLCGRLASIYRHVYRKLVEVGFDHRAESADEVLRLLRHQRETWAMLLEQVGHHKAAGRAKGHAVDVTVTAGLSIAA